MDDIKQYCKELEQELIHLKSELEASKKRENEIIAKETMFGLFYANSSDALLITSPDGGIHAANPAACEMFAWSEAEICKGGRNLLVDLEDKSLAKALKKREDTGYVEGELIFVRKGGEKFIGEFTSNVFTNSEGLARTSMIIRDISERKKADQLLREREQKLIELNNTKDKLFSIIAHDLRSPFNNLKGLSELIITNIEQNKISKVEEYANMISSSAKNSIILLENLLKWAQSQTGQLSFEPEKIILSSLILSTIELKEPLWKTKDITIEYDSSEDLQAYADENMFRLVLRNLISNAVKFTKPGGLIRITTDYTKDHVEISVADNGVGMSQKKLENLFDIFSNKSTAGTAQEKGSGLGLVICEEFVKKNGGEIWATSEEGKGSDFRFTLPVYRMDS